MKKISIRLNIFLPMIWLVLPFFAGTSQGQTNDPTAVKPVPLERMQQVYENVKTPFKYGIVIHGETNLLVDGPRAIFRQDDNWYMVYVG